MDATELANYLGVPRRTIYAMVDQGLLPCRRVGKRLIRFAPEDVEELHKRSQEHQR